MSIAEARLALKQAIIRSWRTQQVPTEEIAQLEPKEPEAATA